MQKGCHSKKDLGKLPSFGKGVDPIDHRLEMNGRLLKSIGRFK
jgi:hypothetical protein